MSDNAPITPPVFDGHNDILSLLYDAGLSMDAPVDIDRFITGMSGHLDADKMRKGGFAGGFFAIWVPSPIDMDVKTTQMNLPVYDLPLPPEIALDQAVPVALAQAAILHRMEAAFHCLYFSPKRTTITSARPIAVRVRIAFSLAPL